ncbi:unnamed protein product [Calypogeia fissa]
MQFLFHDCLFERRWSARWSSGGLLGGLLRHSAAARRKLVVSPGGFRWCSRGNVLQLGGLSVVSSVVLGSVGSARPLVDRPALSRLLVGKPAACHQGGNLALGCSSTSSSWSQLQVVVSLPAQPHFILLSAVTTEPHLVLLVALVMAC